MAGKSRSKSPKGRKSGGGFDINDANIQLAIQTGVISLLAWHAGGQGGFDQNSWTNLFTNGFDIPFWPFGGFVITMHCLNSCQNAGSGFWVNSFVHAYFACFAGVIVPAIVSGDWSGLLANETNATLVFVCWYLTNHNIPVADFDLWGQIQSFGGNFGLQTIMDLSSTCFTTGLIIAGASASAGAGYFGHSWFVPMAGGIMAGCASDFFPLNKGINIKNTAACERAMWISFFICSNGCAALPFVGDALGGVFAQVTGPFGGNAGFVYFVTIVNALFGQFIPMNPLDNVNEFFYKFSGLQQ